MRFSTTFTTALVLALGAQAVGCGNAGGSRHADSDGDRRNDAVDQCPGTPAGTMTGPDGCAAEEDGDHDGLTTRNDLCPGTAAGASVDAFGCSPEQREAGVGSGILHGESTSVAASDNSVAPSDTNPPTQKNPNPAADTPDTADNVTSTDGTNSAGTTSAAAEAQALLDNPPPTGTLTNGYVALVLDEGSERPFVFHTFYSNITQTDAGFDVHGALMLATPLGELPIANASVTFAYGTDRSKGLETLRGDANVPFPSFGAAQGFTSDDVVSAARPAAAAPRSGAAV